MVYRSSFSQCNLFQHCKKSWYLSYIQKVKVITDTCYMDAGNAVHYSLKDYYSGKVNLDTLKETFEKNWASFKLDDTKLGIKKDAYWLMVLNGMMLNVHVTTVELNIFYPEVTAYLDAVDSENDVIRDWKTSTRYPENEIEYRQQLMLYAWLYYRKFKRIPKKLIVHYLKYTGTKSVLEIIPTYQDLMDSERWFTAIQKEQELLAETKQIPDSDKCNFGFCSYLDICKNSGTELFKIHIMGSYLRLEGRITELLDKQLTRKFSYTLKDAFWIKKHNPMATGVVRFWRKTKAILPIGFLSGMTKTLNDYIEYTKINGKVMILDHRKFDETKVAMPDKILNKELRDYQVEAVETFMKEKIGILEIGTGGGKTICAAEIIRRLGRKTLFIVDKIELLRQTKQVFEEALGIEVGEIGAGMDNIKDVTVATMQTLHKNLAKYAGYLQTIRVLAIDEIHHASCATIRDLGMNIPNAEYRLGISASAYRDDKEDMKIYSVVGYIIHRLPSSELIENGWLMRPNIFFVDYHMDENVVKDMEDAAKEGLINETPNYNRLYQAMIVDNEIRNNNILNLVEKNKKKKILILVKRVEHGKKLQAKIGDSFYIYGAVNTEVRKDVFKDFRDKKTFVLIGTLSIFAEGIDIPDLEVIISAGAQSGSVKTIQSLGRVLRKLDGKEGATYYDFMDFTKFFKGASFSRMKALKDEGHIIKKESGL